MKNNQLEEEHLAFADQMEDLLRRNMPAQALDMAEERLSGFPYDAPAREFLHRILIELGRIEESRADLQALERDLHRLSFVYWRAAEAYRKKGLSRDAIACYRKFLSFHPLDEYSAEAEEKIAELQKEDAEAGEAEEVAGEMPGPDFYTVTLAELYINQGHLEMAADVLHAVIKREPLNVQARVKFDAVKAAITSKTSSGKIASADSYLLRTLSCWLANIDRLKRHETAK